MIPTNRQQQILSLLAEQGTVQVDDLSRRLGVSAMTVHRDLDALEQSGKLRKVRGGAVLPGPPAAANEECITCHMRPRRRLQVILHFSDGTEHRACCPHCGLLTMARSRDQITSMLVTDFLFERVTSARDASYVVAPDVALCCTPTVLAFESRRDAERFQIGFGGQVMDMEMALHFLQTATQV